MTLDTALMKMLNKSSDKYSPCGTPNVNFTLSDLMLNKLINCNRSQR